MQLAMPSDLKKISKYLSLILRHQPGSIGLDLAPGGWVDLSELIAKSDLPLTEALVHKVVATSDKQRFSLSEDGTRIRANQGHSVEVDLELPPVAPPEVLWYGTVDRFLPQIREQGLLRGQRHHVHLSADRDTATRVGMRRGAPVLISVRAQDMHSAGLQFFRSENGVWLTDHVPARFLEFPKDG